MRLLYFLLPHPGKYHQIASKVGTTTSGATTMVSCLATRGGMGIPARTFSTTHRTRATASRAKTSSPRRKSIAFPLGQSQLQQTKRYLSSSSTSSSPLVSSRSLQAVSYLPTYLADARNIVKYHRTDAPDGALQLGVAESQVMQDWNENIINMQPFMSEDKIYYQPTSGRNDAKQAIASYLEKILSLPPSSLRPDGLTLGAGCNAVLENLCFCLSELGDTVLIPTPYYAAFAFDLGSRAGLNIEPVLNERVADPHENLLLQDTLALEDDVTMRSKKLLDPSAYYPTVESLDRARESALKKGSPPKILLLSHPQNPLGICYPPEIIQTCIDWCYSNRIHLISDEIYAGSVFAGEKGGFSSTIKLAASEVGEKVDLSGAPGLGLSPYIHFVYSISKDFALSGYRVGASYTENPNILTPLSKLNDLCQISSQTQEWMRQVLSNDNHEWVEAYQKENHSRLQNRSISLMGILNEFQVPYLEPTAGLFLWIDLSKYLPKASANNNNGADDGLSSSEKERLLYLELIHDHGLLLTPGWSMKHERPGFFRLVFSAASDQEFHLCLRRLRKWLQTKKEQEEKIQD